MACTCVSIMQKWYNTVNLTLNVLHKPCTYKWNLHVMIVQIIHEQSLDYDPL